MRRLQRILEQYLKRCVQRAFTRERPLVIGVGGSVGKTSAKQAIGTVLRANKSNSTVVMSIKNHNNEIGVPMAVFGINELGRSIVCWIDLLYTATITALGILPLRARTFILELATDRPGDMAYLVDMVRPSIGVLTAISPEHTEFLGSIDGVLKEELSLLSSLETDHIAIVNADDAMLVNASRDLSVVLLSFGYAEHATVRILSTEAFLDATIPDLSGLRVRLAFYNRFQTITIHGTVGRSQAYAVACAMTIICALDGDEELAIHELETYVGNPGRMRLLPGIKQSWIIDDTYNSSPRAVAAAVEDLKEFPVEQKGRRIAVMGDMLELGVLAEEEHINMGTHLASVAHELIVVGEYASIVQRAAIAAGMNEQSVSIFSSSSDAGRFLQDRLKKHDVVLVKGSQGNRMERVVREVMAHPEHAGELLVRQGKKWLAKN